MSESGHEGLQFNVQDGIGRITLNRPDAGNAITVPMAKALLTTAAECQSDSMIRCVLLTGNGMLFCAGGDVQLIARAGGSRPEVLRELVSTFHSAVQMLARMSKPMVTLVNGPSAGAGFGLALLGDIVLSARSAHFTAAYTRIGLTPDGGLTWLLPRLVGLRRAQEIILTNRRIGAVEAERIGLITRAVEDDALAREGSLVAQALADASPHSTAAIRALLSSSFESAFGPQLERELGYIVEASGKAECDERLDAMLASFK
jgi:2-(1,2-epoxy-1,2-dihydrophenyl)acetyl-CoA isomerase